MKGAARVASEYYPDPQAAPEIVSRDIFKEKMGALADDPEGLVLLQYMKQLGTTLQALSKTKQAIRVFSDMLQYDLKDTLARSYLFQN